MFCASSGIDPILLCFDWYLTTEKQQANKTKLVLLWAVCSWFVSGRNVHEHVLTHFPVPNFNNGLSAYSRAVSEASVFFCQRDQLNILVVSHISVQVKGKILTSSFLTYNLGHKGWKKSFYTHFVPPHPYAMLTKHFHLTQVCILPFSNIERGNGGVDTYSVDITIIISCFWHFPTQFVQDCLSFHML